LQPFHHLVPLSLRIDRNVFDLDKAHVDDLSIVGLEDFALSTRTVENKAARERWSLQTLDIMMNLKTSY
jgi:hypothetical protein